MAYVTVIFLPSWPANPWAEWPQLLGALKEQSCSCKQPFCFRGADSCMKLKFRVPTCESGKAGWWLLPPLPRAFGIWQVVRTWGLQAFPQNWSHQILKKKFHNWMGIERWHIPVPIYSVSSFVFYFLSVTGRIYANSLTYRDAQIFFRPAGCDWEKKLQNYGSVLKSVRFCFKIREEAESWGRENQIFMCFKRKAI